MEQRPPQAGACGALTGFGRRGTSCSTRDLDWLSRSPELRGFLGRSCTAPPCGATAKDSGLLELILSPPETSPPAGPRSALLADIIKATKRRSGDGRKRRRRSPLKQSSRGEDLLTSTRRTRLSTSDSRSGNVETGSSSLMRPRPGWTRSDKDLRRVQSSHTSASSERERHLQAGCSTETPGGGGVRTPSTRPGNPASCCFLPGPSPPGGAPEQQLSGEPKNPRTQNPAAPEPRTQNPEPRAASTPAYLLVAVVVVVV